MPVWDGCCRNCPLDSGVSSMIGIFCSGAEPFSVAFAAIALIAKGGVVFLSIRNIPTLSKMNSFWPDSCCNVVIAVV